MAKQQRMRASYQLWSVPGNANQKKSTIAALQKEMPHLYHHVTPIVNLAASPLGNVALPFVSDLMAFHSEHVHSGRQSADPNFWASVPADLEYRWPLVAVIKDNWSVQKLGV